jgi:hypothetical protein
MRSVQLAFGQTGCKGTQVARSLWVPIGVRSVVGLPQQADALIEALVPVFWCVVATRTLHPFWGNFRVGGDTLETPDSASMSVWLMRRSTT